MALPDIGRLTFGAGTALIERLREHSVDSAYIRSMTHGPSDLRAPLHPTREALYSDDPRATAVQLFFCGAPVEKIEAARFLSSALAGELEAAGILLNTSSGSWTFPFLLRTVHGLYLFSDYLGEESDAVMGASQTTGVLYQASRPRRPVRKVLDLGCGAGTLALLLAKDAAHVLGTDINPRAVALSRFNAAINGIHNVEFRLSDLFDAVGGECFDLIVSQPPYYPFGVGAPAGQTHTFLHGGVRGDELAIRVIEAIPQQLCASGRGVVFTSWLDRSLMSLPPGHRVVQLDTTRLELHGAAQSLCVIERAGGDHGWLAHFSVPADCWGDVHSWRIDQIIAAEELVRAPDAELHAATLAMPRGATRFEEGSELFLQSPRESLLRFAPIDEETWDLLANIGAGVPPDRLDQVRAALRRGLLIIDPCPI